MSVYDGVIYARIEHPENGYGYSKSQVKNLSRKQYYKVIFVSIGQSNSRFQIENNKEIYNTVQFEFYDDEYNKIDLLNTKWNGYLNLKEITK